LLKWRYALRGFLYLSLRIFCAFVDKISDNENRCITLAIASGKAFGGFKMSGVVGSKAVSPDYFLQFLELRHVTENIQRQGFAPIEGADQ
jgi:hypothetical protein